MKVRYCQTSLTFLTSFEMKLLILTPIAERDVHFYLATADQLAQDSELKIVFLSFYQPGNALIQSRGYEVCDPYGVKPGKRALPQEIAEIEKKYRTLPLPALIQHEKLTFGLNNDDELFAKFHLLLVACETLLSDLEAKYPTSSRFIVQELAGFLGPLALFYAGQKRGWLNYFTEPSFFKGRIHFLKNNLFLKIPNEDTSAESQATVTQYLEKAFSQKIVVAAKKDAHHYRDMGLAKFANWTNLEKLSKKLFYKYIKGEQQEFDHIWNHVRRYLIMLKNRYQNESAYSKIEDLPSDKKILYFPFHVQLDFSLTIRTPEWLDQLRLLEDTLKVLPANMILIAKEHPASIGCLDQTRLQKLLKHPQFRLMHPQLNSHDLLNRAVGVITINSKVGAEALSKGQPVISFGRAFYTNEGYAISFQDWSQVQGVLQNWSTENPVSKPTPEWIHFLAQVWDHSSATELYDLESKNVGQFAQSIQNRVLA